MKTAFVTLADRRFRHGLNVLVYSIKKNAPEFWKNVDDKILITTDIETMDEFIIHRVDDTQYRFNSNDKMRQACYKLALFALTDYDRIVFYEADTLCLGELAPLLTDYCDADFYSVTDYFLGTKEKRIVKSVNVAAKIGDGWVVNKPLLDGRFHSKILDLAEECKNRGYFKMAEQDAITRLLYENHIQTGSLPPEYDFLKVIPELSFKKYKKYADIIKMVHYVGKYKPFLFDVEPTEIPDCGNPLDRIWYEYYLEKKNTGDCRP